MRFPLILPLLLPVLFSPVAGAQCTVEDLYAGPQAVGLGLALSSSNGRLLVGDPLDTAGGEDSGAAYIYELGASGFESQRLESPWPTDYEYFGGSVVLMGDEALIGTRDSQHGNAAGAVYVYRRENGQWLYHDRIVASDSANLGNFGVSMATDGERVVVGANGNGGAAYLFERIADQWVEVQRIVPSTPPSYEFFGHSVDIDGDVVIVGCAISGGAFAPGAAYVFEENGGAWSQMQRIVPPGSASLDLVGSSVAVRGDVVVVGAAGRDWGSPGLGAAFIYERSGQDWVQIERIDGSIQSYSGFGLILDIDDEQRIAVGAPKIMFSGGPRYAEVFERNGNDWFSVGTVTGPGDRFGGGVMLEGGALYVGGGKAGTVASVRRATLADHAHLASGAPEISYSAGETQALQISACPENAGATYHLLGSLSGSGSFQLGNVMVPLGFDAYTRRTMLAPGQFLEGATGVLDADGRASATFRLDSPLLGILVGRTLHHAAVILDQNDNPLLASASASVTILP